MVHILHYWVARHKSAISLVELSEGVESKCGAPIL